MAAIRTGMYQLEKWVSGFTKLAACKIPIKNGCFADLRKQSSSTRLLCGVPFISKHRVVYKYRRNLLNIGEVSRIPQTAFSRFCFVGPPKRRKKAVWLRETTSKTFTLIGFV